MVYDRTKNCTSERNRLHEYIKPSSCLNIVVRPKMATHLQFFSEYWLTLYWGSCTTGALEHSIQFMDVIILAVLEIWPLGVDCNNVNVCQFAYFNVEVEVTKIQLNRESPKTLQK